MPTQTAAPFDQLSIWNWIPALSNHMYIRGQLKVRGEDAQRTCHPCTYTVKRINLPNERSLAHSAHRRITRQLAYSVYLGCEQQRPCASPRCTCSSLASCVSTANHTYCHVIRDVRLMNP